MAKKGQNGPFWPFLRCPKRAIFRTSYIVYLDPFLPYLGGPPKWVKNPNLGPFFDPLFYPLFRLFPDTPFGGPFLFITNDPLSPLDPDFTTFSGPPK